MVRPVRLQLSRRKGFDLQAHSLAVNGLPAVSVARPGKWGNPWVIGASRCSGSGLEYTEEKIADAAMAVRFFCEMLPYPSRAYPDDQQIKKGLSGRNLACWCAPDSPCHADVLLDLANPQEPPR
jgi:hypothetical protein